MVWKGFSDIQATIIVDVTPSEEEILRRADRSRRKNIKKAVDSGLEFIEASGEKEWKEWYVIYCKVWNEGGVEAKGLDFFRNHDLRLFLIKRENKIIGGGVFREEEDKITFRAYASLIEYQELRINDFLYWNSFLYAKKNGKKKVDLGGWQIKARGHLRGVNTFKEKWGGEIVYYKIYSKNPFYILGRKMIRNSQVARWIWDRIKGRPMPRKHEKSEISNPGLQNNG